MRPLTVYDWRTGKRLAFLQNAYNVTYEQQLNSLWSAEFTLPYSDEKKQYCQPFNLVEVWDVETALDFKAVETFQPVPGGSTAGTPMGLLLSLTHSGYGPPKPGIIIPPTATDNDRYVGLFRIMPIDDARDLDSHEVTYTLEHVMGTLLDSFIIGSLELGGIGGENTEEILTEVLSYQDQERWTLNECDYERYFKYEFLDMNLLGSLYYVAGALPDGYYWSFDTKNSPWELNLKAVSNEPVTDIRYKKNIFGITKKTDPRSLCTRLYVYGNDRLSFASINDGKEYVDSPSGISNYGIITSVIHDDRFETQQSLLDYATALVNKLSEPFVTYEINVKAIRNASVLKVGDMVRVVTDDGLDQNLIVQKVSKPNLTAAPNSGEITIGEGTKSLGLIVKSVI